MSAALFRRATAAPRIARAFSTSPAHNLARINIIGNLADTPELQATSTGREIIKYAVASNSGPRDNRHTSWFRVTSFAPEGPSRDFLQSLPKGTLVYVEGDASMSTYQDSEGKTRSSLNVVQRNIEVLKRGAQQSE
ncbi:ssDNA binding protein [Colletotrichum karsti]|uniref:SsDNA binding protein n=1 Tax=Colletotrichum karsti TaxID=1095194 RepID=A0A9P6LGJ1_9PEZI|nr:ssDNA binding protein [Colletotrichum karsti]KAF9871635.1 ssDNA binding protein [Colletotrichum karsti]